VVALFEGLSGTLAEGAAACGEPASTAGVASWGGDLVDGVSGGLSAALEVAASDRRLAAAPR
jgi:hypothetical protein